MGSKVVSVRLDDELLKLVDELVRLGVYGSRSEALRDFIRIGARYARQIQMVAEAVNKLFELEKEEGDIPVRLEGALRQLLGERERFQTLIYVDTSVIVAALDPTDPRREEARKALELHDNKIVSELVIAELASVLARQHKVLISIKDKHGLDDHMMASMTIILYILKRFNLKYISVRGFSRTLFGKLYNPMTT